MHALSKLLFVDAVKHLNVTARSTLHTGKKNWYSVTRNYGVITARHWRLQSIVSIFKMSLNSNTAKLTSYLSLVVENKHNELFELESKIQGGEKKQPKNGESDGKITKPFCCCSQ